MGAEKRPERRDLATRSSRDRLALWLELHPASLSSLSGQPLHALVTLIETARFSATTARELGVEVADLKSTARELEKMANIDSLTGVSNRRAIEERLGGEWERAVRYQRPLAALVADIDRLKQINDAYGHAAGDDLIRETARRLRAVLRSGDYLGRFGGDEFLVVCPETDADSAGKVADKLIRAVAADPLVTGDNRVPISLSVGWAVRRKDELVEQLIASADDALYVAKAGGRARSHGTAS